MNAKTPKTPFIKDSAKKYASLSVELLQNASNKAAILSALQGSIAENKSLNDIEIPEIADFILSYRDTISSPSRNLECPSSQMMNKYLWNARKVWYTLMKNDEVVWRFFNSDLSQNGKNMFNLSSLDFQHYALSFSLKDFVHFLKGLQEAVSKEFHFDTDSLKHIEKIAKKCESACEKMISNYDKLSSELESLQMQLGKSTRILDLQTETLQSKYAGLSEVFKGSILQINTKGVEDYEKTVNLSKVAQEHLKAELAAVKEREDEFLLAVEKEVKNNRFNKYKLESQLESQVVAYDKDVSALQEEYDQMLRKFEEEMFQFEDYKNKIVALRLEHEKMLAEEEAEKVRQKALETKDAAITEAIQLIATYARAFLTRRAAAANRKPRGQGRR